MTIYNTSTVCCHIQDERQRIEDLGGMVIWLGTWRVNGNLSVSRAIGDAKDKKFITADADTVSNTLLAIIYTEDV